ncbi:hypothetical protein SAMN05421789_101154 [Kaistella chaponensis]|uniref:Uncharacterized protein n=1 Tax=Kaistella chaponensis TaxID=713588 RepID=A0A1N7J688_9FLAO|nr:hypothetical protein SAMN05421789_101154 [Kaistella chaponensis]
MRKVILIVYFLQIILDRLLLSILLKMHKVFGNQFTS